MENKVLYEKEKQICKEECFKIRSVSKNVNIKNMTYMIYPRIVDWKIKKPVFSTVENWVTKIWKENNWFQEENTEPIVVYAVLENDLVIYVGKTARGFRLREKEHYEAQDDLGIYINTHECKFIILKVAEDDLDAALTEKKLIEVLKPRFNEEGKGGKPYIYKLTKDGDKERAKKIIELAKYIDDLTEFIRWYIMQERIDMWKIEEAIDFDIDKLSGQQE